MKIYPPFINFIFFLFFKKLLKKGHFNFFDIFFFSNRIHFLISHFLFISAELQKRIKNLRSQESSQSEIPDYGVSQRANRTPMHFLAFFLRLQKKTFKKTTKSPRSEIIETVRVEKAKAINRTFTVAVSRMYFLLKSKN